MAYWELLPLPPPPQRTVSIRRAMYDFTYKSIIMHVNSVLFIVIFRMINTNAASFFSIASNYTVNEFHVNQGTQKLNGSYQLSFNVDINHLPSANTA
jgi:hypothetical protein